ncbi:MAG: hypothetical protein HY900_35115 [Deltaproteobacteria bacterium]|nr:hypothetical protein [Deltaproteobacteria bacterium]
MHASRPARSPVRAAALLRAAGLALAVSLAATGVEARSAKFSHDLLAVSFPSEKEGWACGRRGAIVHTADGGSTWVVQQSGTMRTLTSVSFFDRQNGWAVGDVGTILHTTDGGKTWAPQKSPVKEFLMSVQFVSPLKGWAVGERTTILYTADGGRTWAVQFKDEDFLLKKVSFCDERTGWAAGEYGFIYRTEDGGATWRQQAGSYRISDRTGEPEGGTFLFDIVAVDPRTAWAVGIDGYVTKTTDGGATWQVVSGLPRAHLFAVASDARGRVLIGGDGLLLSSSDGGATFRPAGAEPPVRYGWIYRIIPRGAAGYVGVGKEGWIYLSDGKGEKWGRARL